MARMLAALALLLWPACAAAASSVVIGFDAERVTGAWSGPGAEDGFSYTLASGGLWLQAIEAASTGGSPVPHMQGRLGTGGGTLRIVRSGGGAFTFDGADVARVFLKPGPGGSIEVQGLRGGQAVGADRFGTAAESNAWTRHTSAGLAGVVLDELRITLHSHGATATEAIDNIALTVLDDVAAAGNCRARAEGLLSFSRTAPGRPKGAESGMNEMARISTDGTILDLPEVRFPIDLSRRISSVRELFYAATKNQWDPRADIPWDRFEKAKYTEEQLWAARNSWSRRAWLEYGAISESPAIQIRFAREGRESDLGLFFTIRSQEEARHAEVCYLFAEACGGYIEAPPKREYEGNVETHGVRKMALDPDGLLEALIAALVCAAEEVAFDVFKHLSEITTDPIARACCRGITRDEVRHCAFGWHYMARRIPEMTAEDLKKIEAAVAVMIQKVEMNGYHSSWLAQDDSEATRYDIECDRITCEAGLGSTVEELEKPIFIATVRRIREQMREWGCELPEFHHPRTGPV